MNGIRRLLPRELHDTERPSATAQAVTLYRALERRRPAAQRIVDDPYAALFLTTGSQRLVVALSHATPLRDLAARHDLGGLSTYVLCRHRFIDEHLLAATDVEQVLVLGAGYDSRAHRFAPQLAGRPVFEVDLPPLSRRKAAIIAAHLDRFAVDAYTRVEIDFRRQALADVLAPAGFLTGARTFVVWEGVAPYLDATAVDTTLDALRALCGPGSTLAMDLWDGVGGQGLFAPLRRLGARAIALIGEPVTFGAVPVAARHLLRRHGFTVRDLAEADELTARYATAGRRSFESLYVLAAELSEAS
ncbi:MAG TPA: SAM-dependent methyltransferase [Jatrophihabitans sp.]|jgi:methyltransferase (TIGR00027 family)